MAVWKENGVWCFKVTIKDSFGRSKQIKRQDKEWNKRDATRAESEYLFSKAKGGAIPYERLADEYIEYRKKHVRKQSILTYESINRTHINPYFGRIPIENITVKMILEWQGILLETVKADEYILQIQTVFKQILSYAVLVEYLTGNPFVVQKIKHKESVQKNNEESKVTFVSVYDFMKLLSVVDDLSDRAMYIILFHMGLRIGEAIALKIGDIDFQNKTMTIDETHSPSTREDGLPKSKRSQRSIKMSEAVCEVLRELIGSYATYGDYTLERFILSYDKALNYSTIRKRHKKYCKIANVPYFNFHMIRHTYVSILVSQGVEAFMIAKRIGDTVNMIDKTYGHLFPEDDEAIANITQNEKFSKILVRSKN